MRLKKIVLIVLGTVLMAAAINFVYEPMNMVTGGFSGIGILVKGLCEKRINIPVWVTNAVLNLPLFFIAYKKLGKKFIGYTFFGAVSYTVALSLIPVIPMIEEDYFLAAMAGGILTGAGIGLVFLTGSSTGGVDLLGTILHEYRPRVKVSQYIIFTDMAIVSSGGIALGIHRALYAIIAVYVSGRVIDLVLEGGRASKIVYIITGCPGEISGHIIENMKRGVTSMTVTGMYTGKAREMLFVAVGRKEVPGLTEIVKSLDGDAFMIVQDASEVRGEGFSELINKLPG